MNRTTRVLSALCAFFVAGFAFTACGSDDSLPGNSVARVGDELIEKSELDKWMRIAVLSFASQGQAPDAPAPKAEVPDAPNFTKCTAQKRQDLPKPPKGQKAPTAAELKKQCKQEYDSLRDEMVTFLISNEWFKGEAADLDVKVSDKEVNEQIAMARKSLPKGTNFDKFLGKSGQTLADFRERVRISLLQNAIREKVSKDVAKPSAKEISDYYKKNNKQFNLPERRDLRVVLTGADDRAKAEAAKTALQNGESWKTVAKRYSTDAATKDIGGVLTNVTKGPQDEAFDKAVFAAQKGDLVGPIKTQLGWYVFQVQKVTAAEKQSLKEATPTIRQLLTAQGTQKVGKAFDEKFKKKWKAETNCREEFEVPLCDGVPEPKPQPNQQVPPQPQQAPPPQGGQ